MSCWGWGQERWCGNEWRDRVPNRGECYRWTSRTRSIPCDVRPSWLSCGLWHLPCYRGYGQRYSQPPYFAGGMFCAQRQEFGKVTPGAAAIRVRDGCGGEAAPGWVSLEQVVPRRWGFDRKRLNARGRIDQVGGLLASDWAYTEQAQDNAVGAGVEPRLENMSARGGVVVG